MIHKFKYFNTWVSVPVYDASYLDEPIECHVLQAHIDSTDTLHINGHVLNKLCDCSPRLEPAPKPIWVHRSNV